MTSHQNPEKHIDIPTPIQVQTSLPIGFHNFVAISYVIICMLPEIAVIFYLDSGMSPLRSPLVPFPSSLGMMQKVFVASSLLTPFFHPPLRVQLSPVPSKSIILVCMGLLHSMASKQKTNLETATTAEEPSLSQPSKTNACSSMD